MHKNGAHGQATAPFTTADWRVLKFEALRTVACKALTIFATTYRCECTFSRMKLIKDTKRTTITDSNLESHLRCAVTSREPQFRKIAQEIQSQGSH